MKLEEIKKLNITILFSEPINHLLITPKRILNLFKINDQPPRHSLIEAPGLKVFIFPQLQKDIIFEVNRLLVNDRGGALPNKSDLINYLNRLIKTEVVNQDKVVAYGFNFDALISPTTGAVKFTDFIGTKISKVVKNIKEAGLQIIFHKEKVRFDFQIKPAGKDKLLAHLNAHYDGALPTKKKINENLLKQFGYFVSLIKKI